MLADLRSAVRRLRRRPFPAAGVVLTLALGLGAVVTAFSLVHGILLSPLPYPQADRLVRVYRTLESLRGAPNPRLAAMWNRVPVSYLDAAALRRRSRTLQELGLFLDQTAVLEGGGEPEEVPAARVQPELLRALGVRPALGRTFRREDVDERRRVVLLAHGLWRSAFGADPAILERTVRVAGEPHAVIGVMPRGFHLPGRDHRLWLPLIPSDDDLAHRDDHAYAAVARLRAGADLNAARIEMRTLATSLAAEHPTTHRGTGVRVVPLLRTVVEDGHRVLTLLSAAALVILLVASVNAAHLLLAQTTERRPELAVHLTVGASRRQVARRLLAECLLLAVAAGLAGLALAAMGQRLLPALLVHELPRLDEVSVDGAVVLFSLAASLASVLLAGLPAALRGSGVELRSLLSRQAAAAPRRRLHGALVATEVALTLILVAAALSLTSGWLRLGGREPGFDPRGVLVQEVRLAAWRYSDDAVRNGFARRLLARLGALPGVTEVALSSRLPRPGPAEVWGFRIEGRDAEATDWPRGRSATMQFVSPGWLSLLGVPRLAGPGFAEHRPEAVRQVMVNRALARVHWPGEDPVGQRVVMGGEVYTVVGVVPDFRHQGLGHEPEPLMLQPWYQRPPRGMAILVKVQGRPLDHAGAVQRAVRDLDPALPLPPATTLEQVLAAGLSGPRTRALLAALCAGVALLLSLLGTYGVVAGTVNVRRREIGIRMALGADHRQARRPVLRQISFWTAGGIAAGTLGALAGGNLMAGLIHGLEPAGPPLLACAALLLAATCLGAAWRPLYRAGRVDPAVALRPPSRGTDDAA